MLHAMWARLCALFRRKADWEREDYDPSDPHGPEFFSAIMKKTVLVAALLFPVSVSAQSLIAQPSTPDISVSATASADIVPGTGPWDWVYLKNDCSTDLYFNLNPRSKSATDYPLRLKAGEVFSGFFRLFTLGVSNDGAAGCTFTLQGAKN